MAPAPANGGAADGKALNAVAPSEIIVGMDDSDNTMEASGSFGDGDDDAQFTEDDDREESTGHSSSFGASCSGSDDETNSDMDSMGPCSLPPGRAASVPNTVRQKQVTAEWRKAVGPLIWRCRWLELRMKDLLSQAEKYDKELALIKHEKDLQMELIKAGSAESEPVNLVFQSHERNTMNRIKRKRREDTVDTALYIKNHQILSHYYGRKNNGAETDVLLDNDGCNSLVVEDLKSNLGLDNASFESRENDRLLEQYSLCSILLEIAGVQSRILMLQGNLSKVHGKYEKLASAVEHAQAKVSQKSKKARNYLPSYKKDGNCSGQKMKDLNSLLQKKYTCSSIQIPPYAHIGHKESADDVLIDNLAAQEEGFQQFEKVKLVTDKHPELFNRVAETPPFNGERTDSLVVKDEPVEEIAPIVKHAYSGNKHLQNPKKRSFPPALKDQIDKPPNVSAKKKKTEEDPASLEKEKHVLVPLNTRRSQRVRKPKIF